MYNSWRSSTTVARTYIYWTHRPGKLCTIPRATRRAQALGSCTLEEDGGIGTSSLVTSCGDANTEIVRVLRHTRAFSNENDSRSNTRGGIEAALMYRTRTLVRLDDVAAHARFFGKLGAVGGRTSPNIGNGSKL